MLCSTRSIMLRSTRSNMLRSTRSMLCKHQVLQLTRNSEKSEPWYTYCTRSL